MKKFLILLLLLPSVCFAQFNTGSGNKSIYTAIHWDDVVFPALSVKVPGENAPGFSSIAEIGGSTGVFAYAFDATTEESCYVSLQTPHAWDRSGMDFHIHWMPSNANTGTVEWGLEYTANGIMHALSSASTILVGTTTISVGVDRKHYITTISENNLIPTPSDSSILMGRVFRNATQDTYDSDVYLLSIDCHLRRRKLGSASQHGD
jgi:hypothetical protein